MQPSLFMRWLVICLAFIIFSATGFAEPPNGAKQLEVDEELKVQQKARQDYAGTWRIETIASKGNMSEPDKRIVVDNKADGTWTLLIDDEEFSSGTNTFCPLCDPQEIDISFTGGQGQEAFCRESMRLKSRRDDSVFRAVPVRDQIVLSHCMGMRILS